MPVEKHGWQQDPFGLHEWRYFSLGQPTQLVKDGGSESYDPPPTQTSPASNGTTQQMHAEPVMNSAPIEDLPPPGWYPDPLDPERLRVWDGGQWTTEVQPRVGESDDFTALSADTAQPSVGGQTVEPNAGTTGIDHPRETKSQNAGPPEQGWWMASDGNWYPPDLHPDHRATVGTAVSDPPFDQHLSANGGMAPGSSIEANLARYWEGVRLADERRIRALTTLQPTTALPLVAERPTYAPPSPPAGWYPDPDTANGSSVRYWDGFAWTPQTQPTT